MFITKLLLVLAVNSSQAEDFAVAANLALDAQQQDQVYQAEQQKIREYRLQQWQKQQQAASPQDAPIPVKKTAYIEPQQAEPEADDLFAAALNGNVNQIRRLLAQGLDINVSNPERETALHMAASRGHYSAVIYLVNNGAYVNARTVKNWIPLHHAVRFRHPNIVNYLMKHGSSINLRTSDGYSAVDIARNSNNDRLLGILGAR